MKSGFKRWLMDFPGFEGVCRSLTRHHVRAFMYHRFRDESSPGSRGISSTVLKSHIDLIRKNHSVITPTGHLAAVQGKPQGNCPVAFTVDDGYADFHKVAYPLFRDAGIPAMLFVTTGFVAGSMWFWWEKLEYLLENGPAEILSFESGNESFSLDLTSSSGRTRAWHGLADRCRFLEDGQKDLLIADLAKQLGQDLPEAPPRHLAAVSWDQIREMSRNGILFGAHTINHPILTRVSPETAGNEIVGSRKHLEKELGQPVEWFCYPQGGPADFNDRIKDQVARRFEGCYLSYQTLDNARDPHALPRYGVSDELLEFRWTLCGAEFIVMKIKNFLGMKTGVADSYWAGSEGISIGR